MCDGIFPWLIILVFLGAVIATLLTLLASGLLASTTTILGVPILGVLAAIITLATVALAGMAAAAGEFGTAAVVEISMAILVPVLACCCKVLDYKVIISWCCGGNESTSRTSASDMSQRGRYDHNPTVPTVRDRPYGRPLHCTAPDRS